MTDDAGLFEFLESTLDALPCETHMSNGQYCGMAATSVVHFTPCLHSTNTVIVCDEHAGAVQQVEHPFLCVGGRCIVTFDRVETL